MSRGPTARHEPDAVLVCVVREAEQVTAGVRRAEQTISGVRGRAQGITAGPRSWLTSAERLQLLAIGTPERRREWVSGRLTAKYAVRLRASGIRPRLSPRHIEIVADARGRPRAYLWQGGQPRLAAEISIAHCPGAVVCATSGPGQADVELASAMVLELLERFTRPDERRCVTQSPRPEVTATILWGLKEAAVKCLGGRVGRRRALEVRLDEERGRARVMLHERARTSDGPEALMGGFRTLRQHVVTWVSNPDRPVRLNVVGPGPTRGPRDFPDPGAEWSAKAQETESWGISTT
jgi:phosphopantetheinyl transferase